MLKRTPNRLSDRLASGRWVWLYRALFVLLLVLPFALLAAVNYNNLRREATAAAESKRHAMARLAAATVRGRIDSMVDLAVSFSIRPRLVEAVDRGDWADAMEVLRGVPQQFPAIDRIVLLDSRAVIRADLPHAEPSIVGQSRAGKPWYKQLRRSWAPGVSDVYPRGAAPYRNVIGISAPVRGARGDVTGILLVQMRMEALKNWLQAADIGSGDIVYVVDQRGQLVFHPAFDTAGTLVDFSSVGIVCQVLAGRSGLALNYNPVEREWRLAAYEPVPPYGWGVVVTQPAALAYAERDRTLRRMAAVFAVALAALLAMAYFILAAIIASRRAQSASQRLAAIVESSDDAIMGGSLEGVITSWNSGAERIYGYTAAETVGRPASMLYTPDVPASELPDFLAALSRGEGISGYQTRRRRKDGQTIDVSITLSPIFAPTGKVAGVSTISRDITNEKRLALEREKLLAELSHTLESVKTLKGLLPICAWCKKVRNDEGYWQQIETYVSEHSEADFSHGLCPDCMREHFQEYYEKKKKA